MYYYNIKETAARLRALRIERGYTQEEAAALMGVTRSFLSHIENGSKGCSTDHILRAAYIYDVSTDYLLLGRDVNGRWLKKLLDQFIAQLISLRDML